MPSLYRPSTDGLMKGDIGMANIEKQVEQEAHPYICVREAEVLGLYDGEVPGSSVTLELLPDQPLGNL